MVSKKLYKVCECKRIDAWKFVTSRARYDLVISKFCCGCDDLEGIIAINYAKAAPGDPVFMYAVSDHRYHKLLCDSMTWAASNDLPRMIEHYFVAPPLFISMQIKARIIWKYADENGSTRVLTWVMENRPDIMKLAIPYIRGAVHGTVKWCIENLLESSPDPVNWVIMKVQTIIYENTASEELLDWVVIPPCLPINHTFLDCPACMIRYGYINYECFKSV
jgi:hypothetical protein